MAGTERTVATPSDKQNAAAAGAAMVRTLMGGTAAMRAAGTTYLPKEEAESQAAYEARKSRSFLFNALKKTVEDFTGKVFDKPIALGDDVPEQIKEWAEDIDLGGRHLNVFARDVFKDGLQPGISFILVDMPVSDAVTEGRTPSVAEEKAANIRPYLIHVKMENILGWKSAVVNGVEKLTQLRIREYVSEPAGDFDEKLVEQVRVLEPGKWTTYRKDDKNNWVPYQNGATSLDVITLVPVYINQTGFMTGEPPLQMLAEKNVEHWQSSSDQRNILHVARVPILFGAGFNEDDQKPVSASSMFWSTDANAKLSYVEHTGQAIGAGREDLKDIEFQMQAMGLLLMVGQANRTAAGEIRDDSKENSPLAMMATALGDAIEQAFIFMAQYAKLGKSGGSVTVNTDYGIAAAAATDVPQIISAHAAGLITRITAITELKRRGLLADSIDPQKEAEDADAEAAAALDSALNRNPPPDNQS